MHMNGDTSQTTDVTFWRTCVTDSGIQATMFRPQVLVVSAAFIIAVGGHFGIAARSKAIRCRSPCHKVDDAVVLSDTKQLSCSADYIGNTPWSYYNEITAPKPKSLKLKWYIDNGTRIALNVTWTQKISDLDSGGVEGYYLQYGLVKMRVKFNFREINESLSSSRKQRYVRFFYECIGVEGDGTFIQPNDNIIVKVTALPMHLNDTTVQTMKENITIPDCTDSEKLVKLSNREISSDDCRSFWKARRRYSTPPGLTTKSTTPGNADSWFPTTSGLTTKSTTVESSEPLTIFVEPRRPDHTIYYILVCVLGTFFIIALLIMVAFNSEANRMYQAHEEILMIGDTQDGGEELDIAHKLVAKLRGHYAVNATCNWENQRNIEPRSLDWYTDAINKCSLIVFIMNKNDFNSRIMSKNRSESTQSDLLQVFNYTQTLKTNESVDVIFLITGQIDTISSLWMRQRSRYSVYDTSNTFWMFLARVSGRKISKKITLKDLLRKTKDSREDFQDQEGENVTLVQPPSSVSLTILEEVRRSQGSLYENNGTDLPNGSPPALPRKDGQAGAIPKQSDAFVQSVA